MEDYQLECDINQVGEELVRAKEFITEGSYVDAENQVPKYLYKWVDGKQFQKYIDAKKLPVKRGYAHYIESEGKMIPGNSFTDKEHVSRWTGDTLIRIDTSKIPNRIYPIPGHKTFMRTKGMTSSTYDPNAWKYESDEIDEYWIAGQLDLSSVEVEEGTSL